MKIKYYFIKQKNSATGLVYGFRQIVFIGKLQESLKAYTDDSYYEYMSGNIKNKN